MHQLQQCAGVEAITTFLMEMRLQVREPHGSRTLLHHLFESSFVDHYPQFGLLFTESK